MRYCSGCHFKTRVYCSEHPNESASKFVMERGGGDMNSFPLKVNILSIFLSSLSDEGGIS